MERLTTDIARTLLEQYLKDPNNRIHSRESEVVMRALARRLSQDEELWGIAGLLHDLDWEQVGDNYSAHGHITMSIKTNLISRKWKKDTKRCIKL